MKGKILFLLLSILVSDAYASGATRLDVALQNTYRACVDIDDNLHDLKTLAGINTAVTAVGTGLGAGALVTGLVKANLDKQIEQMFIDIRDLSNEYQGQESSQQEKDAWLADVEAAVESIDFYSEEVAKFREELLQESEQLRAEEERERAEKEKRSKNLGNWRTGLLAANTATNIAGAIIASKTINKDDIQGQVKACVAATQELNRAIAAARMQGTDVTEAKQIHAACSEFEYVDVSPINKRGKGALISSSVGAGLGGVGTVVSGIANSDKIRSDDTETGKAREKKLNTTSNVLAAGATVASATATIFNASQISAVKKLAAVSQKCTEVLR